MITIVLPLGNSTPAPPTTEGPVTPVPPEIAHPIVPAAENEQRGWQLPSGGTGWSGYKAAVGASRSVVVATLTPGRAVRMILGGKRQKGVTYTGPVTLETEQGEWIVVEVDGSLALGGQPGQGTRHAQFWRHAETPSTYALKYEDRFVSVQPDGCLVAKEGLSRTSPGVLFQMTLGTGDKNLPRIISHDHRALSVVGAPMWIPTQGIAAPNYAWQTGIITYAGKDVLQYIDSAVMLGLSLQKLVPEFPRVCMVADGMPIAYKDLLANAGWAVIDVQNWHVNQPDIEGPFRRFYDSFAKVNCFRINMRRALWMDADMLLYSARLRSVLDGFALSPGHVAMVKDVEGGMWGTYNSGLMLYQPDVSVYQAVSGLMAAHTDQGALDQVNINAAYAGKIQELPPIFNYHRTLPPDQWCTNMVVGHFTGPTKGTTHDIRELEGMRTGVKPQWGVECPDLYRDYYCRISRHSASLSQDLQNSLAQVGLCISGLTYEFKSTTTATTTTGWGWNQRYLQQGGLRLYSGRQSANTHSPAIWAPAFGGVVACVTLALLAARQAVRWKRRSRMPNRELVPGELVEEDTQCCTDRDI